MQTIGEIKAAARADLRRASPAAWLMTLAYLALTSGLSYVVGIFVADPVTQLTQLYQSGLALDRALLIGLQTVGGAGIFLNLLLLLTGVVFDFGYSQWCLGTTRGGIGEFSDLMGGFAMTGRVLLLRIMTLLYCFMWYVVIFMPLLLVVLVAAALPLVGPILILAAFIGGLVLYLSRILGYAMAPYCLMDEPDMGVANALRTSRKLMWRQVGRFVRLLLSFIGWYLLGILISLVAEMVLGWVGAAVVAMLGAESSTLAGNVVWIVSALAAWPFYLWLTPYMSMAQCRFYDALKNPEDVVHF